MNKNRQSFRQMREALQEAAIKAALILALPDVEWTQLDYALWMSLETMFHQAENPTYRQMTMFVVSELNYLKRLINRLPVEHEKLVALQADFDRLAEPYKDLIK